MYQALYRKYRPRAFEDVVGQEHITDTLRRQVASGRTSHAYLFVGTRGTGKTTCAKILARALNCEHPVNGDPCNECASCRGIESGAILDVAEIDAASNNGVDNIRSIRDEAVYTPAEVKKRVYIIDEVHMLSVSAFNALLKILEEPPEHLVFILATTELNKVPATILSRCQHFSFHRIMPENIQRRLDYVAEHEGFTLTPGASALLSRLADGSMRDALSLLDQCLSSDTVDENAVLRSVGLMGTENTVKLWNALRSDDAGGALELFDRLYSGGAEAVSVLNDLLSLTRDMLMVRVAPTGSRGLLTGALSAAELSKLSSELDTGRLLAASETLQESADSMKDARDKRTRVELCLVKLTGLLAGTYRSPVSFEPPAVPAPERPQTAPTLPRNTPERPKSAPFTENNTAPAPPKPAEAAPKDDGPPPWEDADIPTEGDFVPEPPDPGPTERRDPPPAAPAYDRDSPAPSPDKPAPAQEIAPAEAHGDWWDRVLADCSKTLEPSAFTFLSNRENLVPVEMGSALILHAKNAFVKMMVDSAAVKAAVAQSATAHLGRAVSVSVAQGLPENTPAPEKTAAPERDRLDELSKFEGIVKFK